MVILRTVTETKEYVCKNRKDEGSHTRRRTRLVYEIKCDACEKVFRRPKSEAWHLGSGTHPADRHACSLTCVGALGRRGMYEPKRVEDKDGYILIGNTREHRLVAETMLGRTLESSEVVHHVNGDKADNRPENLFVCGSMREHNLVHKQLEEVSFQLVRSGLVAFCHTCGNYYHPASPCAHE